jgi:predicted nucleic acid-binding protein
MRIAVIDSSSLINLVHLSVAFRLGLYFDRVYVPRHVQSEVNRKHRFRYQLNKLYGTGVFVRCTCKDETNFRMLARELDAGEAEALVQAQEQRAEFFLADERKARAIGARQGLTVCGTVRLLARLSLEGYADDTWSLVRRLRRECRFRVGDDIVEEAIEGARDPI